MPNLTVDPQPEPLVSSPPFPINPFSHNFSKSILIGILIFVSLSATAYGAYWYTKSYLIISSSQPTLLNTTPQTKNSFGNLNNQATPVATDEAAKFLDQNQFVIFDSPKSGEMVKSPLLVKGKVDASWMFEGGMPVELYDDHGRKLASVRGNESVSGSWLKGGMVDFSAELEFSTTDKSGNVYVYADNARSSKDDERYFGVRIKFSN